MEMGFDPPVSLPPPSNEPGGLASLGLVAHPAAFAVGDFCNGGAAVYGNASKR